MLIYHRVFCTLENTDMVLMTSQVAIAATSSCGVAHLRKEREGNTHAAATPPAHNGVHCTRWGEQLHAILSDHLSALCVYPYTLLLHLLLCRQNMTLDIYTLFVRKLSSKIRCVSIQISSYAKHTCSYNVHRSFNDLHLSQTMHVYRL